MDAYAPIHPERPLARTAVALAVSLGVHAVALGLIVAWAFAAAVAAKRAEAARPKEVSLARLDEAQWERNRSVAKTFVPTAAFDNPAAEGAKPERVRFLSDRDRRAERETVAKPAPGMPGRAAPAQATNASPAPPPRVAKLSAPAGETAEVAPDGFGAPARPREPDLQPTPQATKPLVMNFDVKGEGGVPDVDGVAVGNLTVLNAEAWRYATFFDRVGATLYGVWRVEFLPRPPVPSVAAHPRGGSVRVAFGVSLDASGRAVEVTVRRGSGLQDVDELLAELIKRSAPFPNVPPGLLDSGGRYSDVWIIGLVWGWRQP